MGHGGGTGRHSNNPGEGAQEGVLQQRGVLDLKTCVDVQRMLVSLVR